MSKANGESRDQLARMFQSSEKRSPVSRARVGSVDGTRAHGRARLIGAQRYALANGRPSSSSMILLILETVDARLLHREPRGHESGGGGGICCLSPTTLFYLFLSRRVEAKDLGASSSMRF